MCMLATAHQGQPKFNPQTLNKGGKRTNPTEEKKKKSPDNLPINWYTIINKQEYLEGGHQVGNSS